MKTIRTITQVVERDEDIRQKPKLHIGDFVEIYTGHREGHGFWIKDVRFNHDRGQFEYCYGAPLLGGWHLENNLVLRERKAP